MKRLLKTPLFSLSVILFCFNVSNSFAQFPGMAKVYSDMNTRMMQQRMDYLMMYNLNHRNDIYNEKYLFHVFLKDSTRLEVVSKMYSDTGLHKNYLLFVDKKYSRSDPKREQKIYPDQTIGIARSESAGYQNKRIYINGLPSDSCWMFKSITGQINAYSYLSEMDNMYFNAATICGIQLNDGPIVKVDVNSLTAMVGDNKDALAFIKKKNYYKAIKRYNKDVEKAAKK